MPHYRFLVDYRGVSTDELYYVAGQVVDLDKVHQPFNVPELLADGRVEVYDINAAPEAEVEVEDSDPVEGADATQAAVELAAANDLSLALIEGSGDEGRILVGDVQAVLELLAEDDGAPVELDEEPEEVVENDGVGAIMNTEDGGW